MLVQDTRRRGGYSGFGATGAKFPIVGDVGFNEQWSLNDWQGGAWKKHIEFWKLASYSPLSPATIVSAGRKLQALKEAAAAGSDAAASKLQSLVNDISALADTADALTVQHDVVGGYSDGTHKARAVAFSAVNQAVQRLASATVPAPPADAVIGSEDTKYMTTPSKTTGVSTGASTSSGGGGGAAAADTGIMSYTLLGVPLVIGIPVLLAAGVGAVLVLKPRRSTAVAGYRRLRRSRR